MIGNPKIKPPAGPGGIPTPWGIGKVNIIFNAAFKPPSGALILPGKDLNFFNLPCTF